MINPLTHSYDAPPVVGLLGGSFNPAHDGHVHISQEAMRLLGITHVWWMVSPQNPLKSSDHMADFSLRLAHATQLAAADPRIVVTDIEQQLASQYTTHTLQLLRQRFVHTRFIWLMGADNLAGLHRWQQWRQLFEQSPMLVLDRAPLSHSALRSKAAMCYKNQRVDSSQARLLTHADTPIWSYAHIRMHPESATNLRKRLGSKAFMY